MAWIRLSDDYVDHEKFQVLGDGAFRLWHEAMAYCRRHQTDGLIPFTVMRGLRSFTKGREKELATAARDGLSPLWELVPALGYKVHDYLGWNPSRDEELERRAESKERMRVLRERRHRPGVPPPFAGSSHVVRANSAQTSRDVLVQEKEKDLVRGKGSGENPTPEARAGWLLERYAELYSEHRGATLLLIPSPKHFQQACELVKRWPDTRLEKLAAIVLTTDADTFIVNSDRGFPIFFQKASWADNRLAQWEREQGVSA